MTTEVVPAGGPCAPARSEVDSRCAEAERLAQAAVAHEQRLRDLKRRLADVNAQRNADAQVRDRRQLQQAKDDARQQYRAALMSAKDQIGIQEAARTWLAEIDRLNRQLELAGRRSEEVVNEARQLESELPAVELAADAARIAAESAQEACLEARRALAECEEDAQQPLRRAVAEPRNETAAEIGADPGTLPINLVLDGDREALLALTARLAEETGVEAGRLQLLLLELREAIARRALEEHALRFPEQHPFWSQFTIDVRQRVAASLAAMNYLFDGHDGWVDGRAPTIRELAIALSHCGLDPRTLRRPAGQAAIDGLWRGTTVVVDQFLAARAPQLELQQMTAMLGPSAARLAELWDMWGRLRTLLLTPG